MKKKPSIVIKGKKGQQLNQREVKLINDYAVEGLLLLDPQIKGSSITLRYNVEGLIPLDEFLRMTTMSERLFVVLLRNVVLAMKSVEKNHFSKDLIEWSLETSYVSSASWRVYLMYIPLQPHETTGSLKDFLLDLVSHCMFSGGENLRYVQELVKNVNSEITYTASMLEKLCDRISQGLAASNSGQTGKLQCPSCKSELASDEDICPFCGGKIRSNAQFGQENMTAGSIGAANRAGGGVSPLHTGGSVSANENGVVTFFKVAQSTTRQVWLENCSHTGKIPLTKFPFRVGKMEEITDHRIYSNLVSRKHADIIKEQGQYFVVDLGSTNGTFLNGKRLQPGVKELLADGSRLRFADAEYKIHID